MKLVSIAERKQYRVCKNAKIQKHKNAKRKITYVSRKTLGLRNYLIFNIG